MLHLSAARSSLVSSLQTNEGGTVQKPMDWNSKPKSPQNLLKNAAHKSIHYRNRSGGHTLKIAPYTECKKYSFIGVNS